MFEICDAHGGGYFWHLKGANGERICHSEVYTTKPNAARGVAAMKRYVAAAPTYDRTKPKR
jgi:uncharacterized protein YegP (UPF0339 family)